MQKMPGQLDSLKPRKRKSSSRKASTTRRKCIKSPNMQPAAAAGSSSAVDGYSKADGAVERLSAISCECQQSGRRRCSASPELEGQEGKENEVRTGQEVDSCTVTCVWDKHETEDMDCEESSKNIFPDDDSNQILPVEQFFGNLDAVQDFPQRPSASSARGQHDNAGRRRRHYYAPENSDEEEAGVISAPRGDRGDT
ncbi:UPF0688 protein C1orf174 homolog isoform X1 [Trematomus bernacchii]|uniref:UPF0688 protein C1orf174 homolog isoform X1 n=1 Tax=Trematomus bernacchii TaxID=40690 RepID=UPI00146C3E35|nr:UPF0688 protein C1orf174 homolog isoform X1 [Trematomus bernacchii]